MSVAAAFRMRSESGTQFLWVNPTIPHTRVHLYRFLEMSLRFSRKMGERRLRLPGTGARRIAFQAEKQSLILTIFLTMHNPGPHLVVAYLVFFHHGVTESRRKPRNCKKQKGKALASNWFSLCLRDSVVEGECRTPPHISARPQSLAPPQGRPEARQPTFSV